MKKSALLLVLGLAITTMAAPTMNAWNYPGPGRTVVTFRTHPTHFAWKVANEAAWIAVPTTHANYDVIVAQIMDAKRTGKGIEVFVASTMLPSDPTIYQATAVGTF